VTLKSRNSSWNDNTERDVTYIVLSVYLLTLIDRYPLDRKCVIRHKIDHTQVNLIQPNIFELELDFAEHMMCGLRIFSGPYIPSTPSTG